jgi:hypothetical protein
MHLSKLIHSKTGKTVTSILLGIGLATFFRAICKDKNCLLFEAPPLDEIEKKIYKHDNKCYTYTANSVRCDPKKQTVNITTSTSGKPPANPLTKFFQG